MVSLQKVVPADDLPMLSGLAMECALEGRQDFLETAEVIRGLDLVIAVDTAVAHLAASIGKQVWLILPEAADWRWGMWGDTTPWYPTMRLFRHTATREELVARLAGELKRFDPLPDCGSSMAEKHALLGQSFLPYRHSEEDMF